MSFVERAITIVITAGPSSGVTFGAAKSNTLTLEGHAVSCAIDYPGGTSAVSAQISVYGMTLSDMDAIASIEQPFYCNNLNIVSVLAGDAVSGMSLVFQGVLQMAVVNTSAAPRVSFDMTAYGGYGIIMTPVPPASFAGAASVATIMAGFAEQGGMGFENNGITAVLSNPYFPGTLGSQIKACAKHANINYLIDQAKGAHGTLAIWPKNGYRGGAAVQVNPSTGMVGYPRYTQNGIDIDMLFNPNVVFGGLVQVTSELKPACRTWVIFGMWHQIESLTPKGEWLTTVSCFNPALFAIATGGSA